MDLLTIIQTVLRRWYVAAPVAVVALVTAGGLQVTTPPEYESSGTVLLEEPQFDPARLPRSLANADHLVNRLTQEGDIEALTENNTEVVPLVQDSMTIEVRAIAPDPSAAEATVERILEHLRTDLEELQDAGDFPASERLQGVVPTPDIVAEPEAEGVYLASGTLILRDPAAEIDNPFRADERTTRLLREIITSDEGEQRIMEETGTDVSFSVGNVDGPIMSVTTSGPDPEQLLHAYGVILRHLDAQLDARQERAEVPTTRRIQVTPLATPQSVSNISPPVNRAVAAIVGLGGMLAVGLALTVDNVAARRRHPEAPSESSGDRPDRMSAATGAATTVQASPPKIDLGLAPPSTQPQRRHDP